MLDNYFKKPLFWDYLISIIIVLIISRLCFLGIILIPLEDKYTAIASDITNISLTSSGFILTLLTVLITFKSGSDITEKKVKETNSTFELFFSSSLYFETVKHLKNCIKSLLIISILGFTLKICLTGSYIYLIFYFNIIGLTIIVLTLWRCLLILSKILEMQKRD
ncbi:MAG: hypothetical protein RLY43_1479 [Bacteroidota bacterium]|jgi:hypothetical protein